MGNLKLSKIKQINTIKLLSKWLITQSLKYNDHETSTCVAQYREYWIYTVNSHNVQQNNARFL